MAGQSFTKKDFLQLAEKFVPVLIDGDAEPDVAKRYGVGGFPAVKFLRSNGEALSGFMGFVSHDKVLGATKGALKAHGPIRYSKAYKKLVKAGLDLAKNMKKEKYASALKAIATIEKIGHEGAQLEAAKEARQKIEASAKAAFEAAEALVSGGDKAKGIRAFKKVQKQYKGHEIADRAKARVKELEADE